MSAEFLRHEYTWSKQSIGGDIGLGIVSSSIPKDKEQLREIEKIASMAEADSETGMDVELLTYHECLGFVKMTVTPAPAAEDQRKNKKVYLYQCADPSTLDPDVYCLPQGSWHSEGGTYLAPVALKEDWDSPRNILIKYGLMDRLPDVFRAVFWCVFRGSNNLAFVAKWNREEYAIASREIMYAIHQILPASLRKNAGYASYGCGSNAYSSFYFTDKSPKGDYFLVEELEYHSNRKQFDSLDQFFYQELALLFWEDKGLCQQFMEQVEEGIQGQPINKNLLREVQCLFLQYCLEHGIEIPALSEIMDLLPQFFYQAEDSVRLKDLLSSLMDYYHKGEWKSEDYAHYLSVLENGMTRKGEQSILQEIHWVLDHYGETHPVFVKDYLQGLAKNKKKLYTRLLSTFHGQKNSPFSLAFENYCKDFEHMQEAMGILEADSLSEEIKDAWLVKGIERLNDDVFCVEHFHFFTRLSLWMNRKDDWCKIIASFLEQLQEGCERLSDEELGTACDIEKIYDDLNGESQKTALKAEFTRRFHEVDDLNEKVLVSDMTAHEEEQNTTYEKDITEEKDAANSKEAAYEENDMVEEEEEENGNFLSFFVGSLPYGFLTGCILYLLNYALVIGHWKISLGVGGMWLILILNYMNEHIRRRDGYHLWKAIGLCLVEGYIVQIIAWLFLPPNLRVYFFLIVGALTVLTQLLQMFIQSRKAREDEESL